MRTQTFETHILLACGEMVVNWLFFILGPQKETVEKQFHRENEVGFNMGI